MKTGLHVTKILSPGKETKKKTKNITASKIITPTLQVWVK